MLIISYQKWNFPLLMMLIINGTFPSRITHIFASLLFAFSRTSKYLTHLTVPHFHLYLSLLPHTPHFDPLFLILLTSLEKHFIFILFKYHCHSRLYRHSPPFLATLTIHFTSHWFSHNLLCTVASPSLSYSS